MSTLDHDRILSFRGQDLYDRDGGKIGSIDEIYLNAGTNEPEWALVHSGLFGTKRTFVPLRGVSEQDGSLRAAYGKDQIKDAPKIEADGQLSQSEESTLYDYYGLDYGSTTDVDTDRDARGTVGHDTSGPTTDKAMTRSEEELRVGKTERESGRARLRKYVVTENVTQTVPVRREEIRVEREPITDANVGNAMDGPAISEEEHEIVLHEEEVVVDKKAVPKERVRLDKEIEVEERTVDETVRREEIEVEGDTRTTGRTDRR